MMETFGLFCVLVLLVFVYIYKDKDEFKKLTTQVLIASQDSASTHRKTNTLEASVKGLVESFMKQKLEIEKVQEHLAWVREQQQILGRNQKKLQRISLDRNINVYLKNDNEIKPLFTDYAENKDANEIDKKMWNQKAKSIKKQMDGLSV